LLLPTTTLATTAKKILKDITKPQIAEIKVNILCTTKRVATTAIAGCATTNTRMPELVIPLALRWFLKDS